jgi:hypothetical protein
MKTTEEVLKTVRTVFEQKLGGDPEQIVNVTKGDYMNYLVHHKSKSAVTVERKDIDDNSINITHTLRRFLQ